MKLTYVLIIFLEGIVCFKPTQRFYDILGNPIDLPNVVDKPMRVKQKEASVALRQLINGDFSHLNATIPKEAGFFVRGIVQDKIRGAFKGIIDTEVLRQRSRIGDLKPFSRVFAAYYKAHPNLFDRLYENFSGFLDRKSGFRLNYDLFSVVFGEILNGEFMTYLTDILKIAKVDRPEVYKELLKSMMKTQNENHVVKTNTYNHFLSLLGERDDKFV